MDEITVGKLEWQLEKSIAKVILEMGLRKLPLLPSQRTMHLMAKAAVSVYEAAVENLQSGRPLSERSDDSDE
jgi:hypothetical protein